MAFTSVTKNIYSILPLLIILLITPLSSSLSYFSPNDKITKQLCNKLCSQPTLYKHFCISWLNSDPTTFTSDLHGLVVMIFQKTSSLGHKNLEMMKGLVRTKTDPKLKIPYESCVKDYESSVLAIDGANGFTKTGNYVLASKAAFKAFDSISNCEALLEGLKMPVNSLTPCEIALDLLKPCLAYLWALPITARPSKACCSGLDKVNRSVINKPLPLRRDMCICLSVVANITTAPTYKFEYLPKFCGVHLFAPIRPNLNCDTIKA